MITNWYLISLDNLIPGILRKTIMAFEYINNNYKHIVRTNLSSFLIIDNLLESSNELRNDNLIASLFCLITMVIHVIVKQYALVVVFGCQ